MDSKKEVELRVFENEQFMLQKDWKFSDRDIETLYCLALPMQRDLRTIRDLSKEHLDLLKSIRDNSYASIEKQFGLPKSQVKAFFHYFPTYYHLHVHFVHVKIFDKAGVMAGKAVFLEDVIENIEKFDPNFY